MDDDLVLALYSRAWLAEDANIPVTAPCAGELSLGHLVGSKAEVDAIVEQARRAGANVTDAPRDRFWGGYSGYFQDPDGHLREIAYNPQSTAED